MKRIEAIIRREKLGEVKDALDRINVPGTSIWEIEGHGRQKGIKEQFRGVEYTIEFVAKMMLVIFAPDAKANEIVETIVKTARTGSIGDGKVIVSPVETMISVRTGEAEK